jgi:hypothetical protein
MGPVFLEYQIESADDFDPARRRIQARLARFVAQDCILLYRGFAIRKAFAIRRVPAFQRLPNAIRRYSRFQICVTKNSVMRPSWAARYIA